MRPLDTSYDAFIIANHQILTMADLAFETDKPIHFIQHTCERLGIMPIKRGKQIENFIRDNKHWTAGKLAKALDINVNVVKNYAIQFGIKLALEAKPLREKKKWSKAAIAYVEENFGRITPSTIQRPDAVYNQTGTELLDEQWGRKTTKRETPKAVDARI